MTYDVTIKLPVIFYSFQNHLLDFDVNFEYRITSCPKYSCMLYVSTG